MESNDPANPTTRLKISVLIDIEFGFESSNLNFGKVDMGASVTKKSQLILKDSSKFSLLKIESNSPDIGTKIIEPINKANGKIDIEVTLGPNLPPGRLNQKVTARLTDDSVKPSPLRISGTIIGTIEVDPLNLHFVVDTLGNIANRAERNITISNKQPDSELQLIDVIDPDKNMSLEIETIDAGKRYRVHVKPYSATIQNGKSVYGNIKIITNDKNQPEISVQYKVIFAHKRK